MSSAKQKQAEANIQTFMRIKPSKSPSGFFQQDDLEKGSIIFTLPPNYGGKPGEYVNNTKLKHSFHFNGIIDANATQEDVFKKVGVAAVQNALEGFNSTIFAYGQTGSGKTFTLTGGPEKYSDRGIIPRAISMLYAEFRTRTDVQFKAYISYLELYNEQGYDLLDPSHETKALEDLPKVSILEDEHGNFHLKNLNLHPAETEEDALNLLFLGDTNRAIAETPMNMASSRSHCIFSLSLEARIVGSDKVRRSKLHLVDLAGSERVAKTNSAGSVLTEARYINSSLFFLEMVIVALYEKATKGRSHIPYRNSMMTSVLRDSLGGNCKTIMIATMNPESAHTDESLSTCKFAQRVSLIKNKALINEEQDPSVLIRRLKSELLGLREEIAFLKGEAGEGEALSPQELEELRAQCRTYCFDRDPMSSLNIGVLSLTKIKDAFAIMKNFVLEANADAAGAAAGGGGEGRGGSGSGGRIEDREVQKQIDDLKSLLLQRDSEIAILVNMVKKGKTAEDVGMAVQRSQSMGSRGGSTSAGMGASIASSGESREFSDSSSMGAQQQRERGGKSFAAMQAEQAQQRERQRQERIVQRHLYGVPPPDDKAVFDDAAASFEWFRQRCALNASLEENKTLLKERISEAKAMGERANQSRSTITYLKNSIEAIRREKVMARLHSEEAQGGTADGKDSGDGGDATADSSGAGGALESEEETTYRRAIDQEKAVYKESFERLRVLKPEIEHIRKVIEKCRATMQGQFDQWYSNLHARGGLVGGGAAGVEDGHSSSYSGGAGGSSSSSAGGTTVLDESTRGMSMSMRSINSNSNSSSNYPVPAAVGLTAGAAAAEFGAAAPKELAHQQQHHHHQAFDSKSTLARSGRDDKQAFTPAPAGSKDTAGDVNEDIEAFYQAKEELLRRRAGGGGGGGLR